MPKSIDPEVESHALFLCFRVVHVHALLYTLYQTPTRFLGGMLFNLKRFATEKPRELPRAESGVH